MINTYPIEAGCAVRGQIRRFLMMSGVEFSEDKGFFDSLFVVRYNDESQLDMDRIRKLDIDLHNAQNN